MPKRKDKNSTLDNDNNSNNDQLHSEKREKDGKTSEFNIDIIFRSRKNQISYHIFPFDMSYTFIYSDPNLVKIKPNN